MSLDPEFQAWIEQARAMPIEGVASALQLRKAGSGERIGPCPQCGGTDRFSINTRKNVFNCRGHGGGDVIALQQLLTGVDFLAACEILTGSPAPRSNGRPVDMALVREHEARLKKQASDRDRQREADERKYREESRKKAFETWQRGAPAAGTIVEAYFEARRIIRPPVKALRFLPEFSYWGETDDASGRKVVLHKGPAMLAAYQADDGRFSALHVTWLAADGDGKARILGPDGEPLPSKKMYGPKKGAAIRLVHGSERRDTLLIGEGIETVLSARSALLMVGSAWAADAAFFAAGDLDNMGGPSAGSVKHPTATITDSRGRTRAQMVKGPEPTGRDGDAFMPPAWVRRVVLLGDGDSDRFMTENALTRAATRWKRGRPGLSVRVAWADAGSDFNDMMRAA
jgi:hypothetical protein